MTAQFYRAVISVLIALPVSPLRTIAQTDSASGPVGEWSLPVGLLMVEAMAFGTATLARSESGARAAGAIDGIAGLAVLSIAGFSDRKSGIPEFTVPYGIGLLALSYYNFDSAPSSKREQRFWTNAIGLNVAVLAGLLSGLVLTRHEQEMSTVTVRATHTGLLVSLPF